MRVTAGFVRGRIRLRHHRKLAGLLLVGLLAAATTAFAGPQGGQVIAGQGSIGNPDSTTTLIKQQSNRLVIDWTSFNVAPDETVQFNQPSVSAAALNRILSQNPSQIFGNIIANGQVYLLNPNGIIFGRTATVNVGGLFATGLNISNDDFMSGKLKFAAPAAQDGGYIINHGVLQAADGGSINLIGSSVFNDGIIIANLGQVNMVGGSAVTVDFNGDGLLQFQVTGPLLHKMVDAGTGAVITNAGRVVAHGGTVVMTAAVAEQVLMQAVDNSGLIQAGSIQNKAGHIYLSGPDYDGREQYVGAAGSQSNHRVAAQANNIENHSGDIQLVGIGGDVVNSGTLNISSVDGNGGNITLQSTNDTMVTGNAVLNAQSLYGGNGGTIQILGNRVGVVDNADVNASGDLGGGTILVGGDYHGGNGVQQAADTVVAPDVKLTADAITSGNGGKIILWSTDYTGFYGAISVKGGVAAGNGGFVETSSHDDLQVAGQVNALSPAGQGGTWLLDPSAITICSGAAPCTTAGTFSGSPTSIFTPNNAATDDVNVSSITGAFLAGVTTVVVDTASAAAGTGTISVQTPIAITNNSGSAETLILSAFNAINFNGSALNTITGAGANPLNVTLWGNNLNAQTNPALSGTYTAGANIAASVAVTSAITTNGGNLTIESDNNAITVSAAIHTGGGSFSSTGSTFNNTGGVISTSGGGVSLNQTGAVTVGAAVGTGGGSFSSTGTTFNNTGGSINSGNGTFTLDQTGGVTIGDFMGSGTGAINITGVGITEVGAPGMIVQSAGAGAVTINAGAGVITLSNATNDFTGVVTLNNTGAHAVSLNNGANALTIGGGTSVGNNLTLTSGALNFGTTTVSGTLGVTSNGAITQTGALTVTGATTLAAGAANNITLNNAGNAFTGAVGVTTGDNVLLTNNIATVLGASTVSGTLGVTSNGAITQTGALTVTGATTLAAGATNNITLSAANKFTGVVSVTTGDNVLLTNNIATALGASTVSGTLGVTSNGAITQTGALTVTGATTLAAGAANNITLSAANKFTGVVSVTTGKNVLLTNSIATALGASTVSGTLGVTSNGAITQTGALTVTGATTLAAGAANNITLNNAGNAFTGAVGVTTGDNVLLTNNIATVLGASTVSGTLGVTSNSAITQTGALTVTGATTLAAGLVAGPGNNITLNNAGNAFTGVVSVTTGDNVLLTNSIATALGASTVSGTLGVTSNGAITQTGALTVTGATTLAAGAANNITLNNAGNAFTGAVGVTTGDNVLLTNNIATVLGASTVSGTLGVTSNGAITQTGALTVTGATTLAAGAANNITLSAANKFTGAVSVTTGDNVLLTNNIATALGASTVSGTLGVTSNGAITQTGALTVTGATTLAAGAANNITLNNAGNAFTGAVSVTTGDNVLLTNSIATALGASTVSGTLGVTSNGAITQTGALTVTGATTLAAGAANNITLSAANKFTGVVSVTTGDNVLLTNNIATALGASTVSGTLGVTSNGAITQTGALTVTGASSFIAGAHAITLANPSNSFFGAVSLSNSGNFAVTLVNSGNLSLGASTLGTGVVSITTNGALTQSGAFSFGGTATLNAGTNLTLNTITGGNTLNLNFDQNNTGATLDFGVATITTGTLAASSGAGSDTFNLDNASITATNFTITGGGGNDILMGLAIGNYTWNLTGTDSGNLKVTGGGVLVNAFTGIENLTGGAGNDTFAFVTGGSLSGTLDGGGGSNRLDYSGFGGAVTINLSNSAATAINGGAANGFNNIQALTGSGANTTLTGPSGINSWDITGLNAGDINGPGSFNFAQVWNLTGAGSQDTFIFSDGHGVQGTITGGADGILDYHLYTSAVTVNLSTNTATGTGGISGIKGLTGTNFGLNLTTLIAGNGNNTWHITGSNAGDLNGASNFSFTQVQNLTGGTSNDDFVFSNGEGVSGTVDGGAGGNNILDFSAYLTPVGITLTGPSGSFGYSGTTSGTPNPTGGFADITQIDEPSSSMSNTLTLANGIATAVTIDSSVPTNLFMLTVNDGGPTNLIFNNISTVNGGTGVTNTLISGEGTTSIWTLTSLNDGSYNDGQLLTFNNFGNLVGGAGNDTFAFNNGSSLSGSIVGGGGIDTLDYSAYTTGPIAVTLTSVGGGGLGTGNGSLIAGGFSGISVLVGSASSADVLTGPNQTNTWQIMAADSGNVDSFQFNGIENLIGGTDNDTFTLAGGVVSFNGSITGGGGVDTLAATNGTNAWQITGANAGTLNTTTVFSGITNLTGGTGNDTFAFSTGSLSGNIVGGGGTDTLDYSSLSGPVDVVLTSVSGGLGTGTGPLIGGNFSGISILNGSASGADVLTGPNQANTWQITAANGGNVDGFQFSNIENLTGGTGDDDFVLAGGSLTGSIDGGGGSNSLQGNNTVNIWTITGVNQGTETDVGGTFRNVGNLVGGNHADTFIFNDGASLSGTLDGGGVSSGNDTIDWSAYTTARNVIITGIGTLDGMRGTEASITGGFNNITKIVGANGAGGLLNSLTGPNSSNTWNVNGSNAGILDGAIGFSNFQVLTGGNGADIFNLSAGVSGSINGGGGSDTANIVASFTAPAPTLAINNVETIADNAGAAITADILAISGATSIGSASKPLRGILDALQITASNGNAFISTVGNVDLQGINLGSGTFTLASSGAITDATGQNVTANAVNLSGVTGIGTQAAHIKTATSNLSALVSGAGNIYASNTGALTMGATSTANGSITITASGALTAGGPITSGGNGAITLTTSSGDLTTSGIIAANGSGNVNLNAAGNLNLDSTISSGTGVLSLDGGTGVTGNASGQLTAGIVNVTASSGNILFTGVTSSAAGGTTLSGPGNITLQGFATTRGVLTIQNGGTFTVAGPVNLSGALAQVGVGPVLLDSGITSSDDSVRFASHVTVGAGAAASITTNGGVITFNQSITGSGGSSSLALNSGAGDINLEAVGNLGSLSLQTSGVLSLGNNLSANNLLTTGVTGNVIIAGTNVDINTTNSNVDFSHAAGINGLTTGDQSLDINSGTGRVVLSPVGQNKSLASLTVNGGTITLASVTTSDAQAYTGNVQLGGNLSSTAHGGVTVNGNLALISNATVNAAGSGNIGINGTVNGSHALSLMAPSGQVTLNGVVGGSSPLTSLTVNSASVNLAFVTTSGIQDYQSGTAHVAGVLESRAGAINFGGILDITAASTIQANGIGFNGGASSVRGTTSLTLLPETRGTTVNIGGSGAGLTLNNIAMDGYNGGLYIGTGPGSGAPLVIGIPVAAGNVTVNGSLTLGSSGSLLLAGMGNLVLNSGTLTANSVTLIAGSQNSVIQNPGTTQTLIDANTVILVSGNQIGELGQELNIQTNGSTAQVQIATGAIESFLLPPDLPVVIGPGATIANDIAAQLGLFTQNSIVTSIDQQIAALAQTGGLLGGFIDVSLFQDISLYDVFGLGITLPIDQCEQLNNQLCNQ